MAESNLYLETSIHQDKNTREYVARVNTPLGGTVVPFNFPTTSPLEQELRELREGIGRSIQADSVRAFNPADIERPQEFGKRLFRALFHGRALEFYRALRSQLEASSSPDRRLIIKINPATYELASLPWELLRDPDNDFLVFGRRTPLIRFIPGRPVPAKTYELEWRILLAASNPPGTPALDLHGEIKNIQQAFEEVDPGIKLTIDYLHAPSAKDLRAKLRDFNPHVFHFMGHSGAGRLLLDAPGQGVKTISEMNLAVTLQNIPALRLVFLNACGTAAAASEENLGLAYALSRAGIPAVVANQFPARDDAAKEMADEFYRVLAGGLPVDEAVLWGRIAVQGMRDNPTLEWATPVLYLQATDGRLFDDLLERQTATKLPTKTASVHPPVADKPTEPQPAEPPPIETTSIDTERIQSLREQLKIHYRNLNRLQEKKAKFGDLHTPTNIENEIDDEQNAIAQIERELAALGQKSGRERPAPPPPPHPGPSQTTGAVRPDPQLRELYYQAQKHLEQQEWDEAIPLLEEVAHIHPTYRQVQTDLQKAKQEREKIRLQELRDQRLNALLDAARAHWEKGQQGEKGEWGKALGLLDEILTEAPDFAGGEAARFQREVKAAYDRYLKDQHLQQRLRTLYRAAQKAMEEEKWSEAISLLRGITEEIPNYEDAVACLNEATRQNHLSKLYEEGNLAFQNRNWAAAVEKFGQIQSLESEYSDAPAKHAQAQQELRWDSLYAEGQTYLGRKDWDNAIEALRKVQPDDHRRRGQPRDLAHAQAMQAFSRATQQAEQHQDREADWEQVINLLTPIVEDSPGYRDAVDILQQARNQLRWLKWYEEGRRQLKAENWTAAIQAFDAIVKENADYRDAFTLREEAKKKKRLAEHYEKGQRYLEHQIWREAREEFQAIVNTDPDYRDAQALLEKADKEIRLGNLFSQAMKHEEGQRDEAIVKLEAIVAEDEHYRNGEAAAKLEAWIKEREVRKAYEEGRRYFEQRQWRLAIQSLERLFEIDEKGYLDAKVLLAQAQLEIRLEELYTEAENFYQNQEWEEAISHYQKFQETWEKATKDSGKTKKLPPAYRDVPEKLKRAEEERWLKTEYQKVRQQEETEQWDKAIATLENIRRRRPNYADVDARLEEARRQKRLAGWYTGANEAFEQEDWAKAVNLFQKIKELNAGDYKDVNLLYPIAERNRQLVKLYDRAKAALAENNLDSAEEALAAALKIDEGYRDVQVKLADVRRQKRLRELYARAEEAFAAGGWEGAIEAYRQVVDMDPEHRNAAQRLQEAERQKKLADFYHKAEEALAAEEWQKAITHYEAILLEADGYRDAKDKLAQAKKLHRIHDLYQSAIKSEGEGDLPGALERYKTILKLDPDFEDMAAKVAELTETLELAELYDKALNALEQRRFIEGIPLLQQLVARKPDYKDAAARLEQAIEDHHAALLDRYNYAQQLKKEKRLKEARQELEIYRRELKKSPWFSK